MTPCTYQNAPIYISCAILDNSSMLREGGWLGWLLLAAVDIVCIEGCNDGIRTSVKSIPVLLVRSSR